MPVKKIYSKENIEVVILATVDEIFTIDENHRINPFNTQEIKEHFARQINNQIVIAGKNTAEKLKESIFENVSCIVVSRSGQGNAKTIVKAIEIAKEKAFVEKKTQVFIVGGIDLFADSKILADSIRINIMRYRESGKKIYTFSREILELEFEYRSARPQYIGSIKVTETWKKKPESKRDTAFKI